MVHDSAGCWLLTHPLGIGCNEITEPIWTAQGVVHDYVLLNPLFLLAGGIFLAVGYFYHRGWFRVLVRLWHIAKDQP